MQIASLAEVGVTNVSTSDTIDSTFAALQRAQLARRGSFTLEARIAQLDQLRDSIKRHESNIIAACAADFRKPAPEVKLTELLPVLQEIRHTKKHLRKWMRPKRVAASVGVLGTKSYVRPEPKGVCLIIAPWNYPLNLALGPLVSALAAGNGAIIKPSEMTPHTSKVIANIVAETFPPDLVSVIEGDAAVAQKLLARFTMPLHSAVKFGRRILGAPTMALHSKREIKPGNSVSSDGQIADFIRENAETIYHPVGTCRMGADPDSVVDPELKVRGIEGLRVVDASIMPSLVAGNTNAPTMMIAENAADILLGNV